MKNINDIDDEMICEMHDTYMKKPVSIDLADLTKPFIYDRDWGVFYIVPGQHQMCMSILYSWRFGHSSVRSMIRNDPEFKARVKANSYSSNSKYSFIADLYLLELEGTVISSSVTDFVQIGKLKNLNQKEKTIFSNFQIEILADILNIS